MTVVELLRECQAALTPLAGSSARLEAEVILAKVRGQSRGRLLADLTGAVEAWEESQVRTLLGRRLSGRPLAYLTGVKEFMSLEFRVNSRVLIPRPETELLVETALKILAGSDFHSGPVVVDVGTGSGNIALSIAHYSPKSRVIAIDRSPAALAVARFNARQLGLRRVKLVAGDLLNPLIKPALAAYGNTRPNHPRTNTVDMVLANLPYVRSGEMDSLPIDVRGEPAGALNGGGDGLAVYRRLLRQIRGVLRRPGWLLAEIGPGQERAMQIMFEETGFDEVRTLQDTAGRPRVIVGYWQSLGG